MGTRNTQAPRQGGLSPPCLRRNQRQAAACRTLLPVLVVFFHHTPQVRSFLQEWPLQCELPYLGEILSARRKVQHHKKIQIRITPIASWLWLWLWLYTRP